MIIIMNSVKNCKKNVNVFGNNGQLPRTDRWEYNIYRNEYFYNDLGILFSLQSQMNVKAIFSFLSFLKRLVSPKQQLPFGLF